MEAVRLKYSKVTGSLLERHELVRERQEPYDNGE